MSSPLEFRILGPFEVGRNGEPLEIPAGKPRALLAVLLLRAGEVVSVDTLVDELWGEQPPATAAKNVQVYVARLRRALGDGVLVTQAPGYALRVDPEQFDAARFQALVEEARLEEPARAAPRLERALALWRGPPLADFAYEPFAQDEIRRLDDLRLGALEDRVEADLALGRHEAVIGELESLTRAHPLRERLQGLLLLALYRCGRQADALEAYRSTRRRFVEELGVEPSPALRQLGPIQVGNGAGAIAFGHGSIWVANATDYTLSRIEPDSGAVKTIPLAGEPGGIAAGEQGMWVSSTSTGQLLLVDADTNAVSQSVSIGNGPQGVAVGGGSVWVANTPDGTVTRFDPGTGRIRKLTVGEAPTGVAYGTDGVWVASSRSGAVARIDPERGSVRSVKTGNEPTAVASVGSDAWVTVLPGSASHHGGTLRLALPPDGIPNSPDPVDFSGLTQWQLLSLTNDGLVTYRRAGGLAGAELVPDLATAIPLPTEGGRIYTFRLRSGIRYSNGDLVRPEDIRRGIARALRSGNPYLADQYSGIRRIASDRKAGTVTFHLARPDPDFLYKLAFVMASAVPAETHRGRPLPATGPYMTRSFSPGRSWVLVRNPRFREWSREAQPEGFPDRIVLKAAPAQQIAALGRGATDVLLAPPLAHVDALARRYANQLHIDPAGVTFALVVNTRVAPFDRVSVRRALNYAVDRNRIVRLTGSSLTAQPTCQILAPTLPGYRPYCPYTLNPDSSGSWSAPDLARAERLVSASGTRGMKVTVLMGPPLPGQPTLEIGRYVVSVLERLGYRASVKVNTSAAGAGVGDLSDSRRRPQIGWFTWFQDQPAPSNFIEPLLTCRAFVPGSPDNVNVAEFCDHRIDAQVHRADALQQSNPAAAGELWSKIDHELVDRAVWVPLYNPRTVTALGARVGNYKYHPFWNVLLDQLWVR